MVIQHSLHNFIMIYVLHLDSQILENIHQELKDLHRVNSDSVLYMVSDVHKYRVWPAVSCIFNMQHLYYCMQFWLHICIKGTICIQHIR